MSSQTNTEAKQNRVQEYEDIIYQGRATGSQGIVRLYGYCPYCFRGVEPGDKYCYFCREVL